MRDTYYAKPVLSNVTLIGWMVLVISSRGRVDSDGEALGAPNTSFFFFSFLLYHTLMLPGWAFSEAFFFFVVIIICPLL